MPSLDQDISVLCVDDNRELADALRVKLGLEKGFTWKGWLSAADQLVEVAIERSPDVVVLDLDMPGVDPFSMLPVLSAQCPEVRVVIFSGHVRGDLLDRAIENGVWGYVAKSDGENELLDVIRRVAAGEYALSHSVRALFG